VESFDFAELYVLVQVVFWLVGLLFAWLNRRLLKQILQRIK
jgi:hypothetical protein